MKYRLNFDCSNNNITSIGGSNGDWQFSSKLLGDNFVANFKTKENRVLFECKKYLHPTWRAIWKEVWVSNYTKIHP